MPRKTLGKKIKQARSEFDLTQADLALRVGISPQLISAFESGRIKPDLKYIEKIAQFTHKPVYYFTGQRVVEALTRVDRMMQELKEIRELLTQITDSPDDDEDN